MAYRRRIGPALYRNESGTFATWNRDENDRVIWTTHQTLEEATRARDLGRRQRRGIVRTPKVLRDMRQMGELLNPKPQPDQWTSIVKAYDENHNWYAPPPDAPFR
jgi:hypothetical protein